MFPFPCPSLRRVDEVAQLGEHSSGSKSKTKFYFTVCCTYPTFKYEGAEGAEFCVKGVVDPPTADKGASDGVDSLTGEKYLKNGMLSFDCCNCFSDCSLYCCYNGGYHALLH